ncbi:MAG: hypothetical protein IPK07_09485 [Deltaproteobacteria bacterium]|nr:hypothetical protein [Deltaproteobacteria bacterium]
MAPTVPLRPGSPAIDSLPIGLGALEDERGVSRPRDGDRDGFAHCDRGAFEVTCSGADSDGDGLADECDRCPAAADADQADGDGTGNACDPNSCSGIAGAPPGDPALVLLLALAAATASRLRRGRPARGPAHGFIA